MSTKKILLSICLILWTLPLHACGQPPVAKSGAHVGSSQPGEDGAYAIALVTSSRSNPFYTDLERGARQAEKEMGIRLIVQGTAQETSTNHQSELVEELIRSNVDAILIVPGDSFKLVPVIRKAQDAGILVITVENRLDPDLSKKVGLSTIPSLGINHETGAYQAAKAVSAFVTAPTTALLLEGAPSSLTSGERKQGALRAFAENENITAVITASAHWKIEDAFRATEEQFAANPDIGVIFCANDLMALGALEYLEQAGRSDVLVSGFDGIEPARQAIKEGRLAVTIDQQAAAQGYLGVQYAVQALNGEDIPASITVDFIVLTAQR